MINHKLATTLLSFSLFVGVGYPAIAQTDSTIVDDQTTNEGVNQTTPASQGVDTPDGSTDMEGMTDDNTIVDDQTTNEGINQTTPASQGVSPEVGAEDTDMDMGGSSMDDMDDDSDFSSTQESQPVRGLW